MDNHKNINITNSLKTATIAIKMQPEMPATSQSRSQRMKSIRASLKQNPVMTKNTDKVQKVLERRERKASTISNLDINQLPEETSPKFELESMVGFDEKYQMMGKIGQGSNGIVRKCRHMKQDKIYAVKSMNIDQQHIFFLKRNFVTIRNLDHPNVISYKALYIDRKKHLCNLVMDYISYPSLLEISVNSDEMRNIIYQIVQAIQYLHGKLICHRDIKPENILYSQLTQNIKIIDFGISKTLVRRNAKTSMLTFTGTLFYKAPEMFTGGGYDQRVDLWALGITIYKLITGVTPFESEYHSQTIDNINNKLVCFSDPSWDSKPKFLQDLISRLLKRNVQQRLTVTQAKKHFYFIAGSQLFLSPTQLTKSLTGKFSLLKLRNNLSGTNPSNGFDQDVVLPRLSTWLSDPEQSMEKWISNIEGDLIESDSQELDSAMWVAKQKKNERKEAKTHVQISTKDTIGIEEL